MYERLVNTTRKQLEKVQRALDAQHIFFLVLAMLSLFLSAKEASSRSSSGFLIHISACGLYLLYARQIIASPVPVAACVSFQAQFAVISLLHEQIW